MEYFSIALRNVKRNPRRSKLTIITIVIGVTVLMNLQGMLRGLTGSIYTRMMAMDTAQVQIEAAGYREDARRLPLDRLIEDPEELASSLAELPEVAAVSLRVDAAIELTDGRRGLRAMARGVSKGEAETTDLAKSLAAGRLFKPGESGLVIGAGLARRLGLSVGDTAWFTAMDRHSARNLGSAPILGIFEYGYPLMDEGLVFLDLEAARSFLDLGPAATRIVVKGRSPERSRELGELVSARLAGHPELRVYDWRVFAENLVSTIDTRVKLLGTILSCLFLLIVAGIFNTMAMNVKERYREIGTLRAIGMRRSGVERIFLAEGLLMGLAGCLIAALPSTAAGIWLAGWGIDVSGLLPRDVPIPFGTALRASYAVSDVLRALVAGISAALLGSYLPARQAARLPITAALGTVR